MANEYNTHDITADFKDVISRPVAYHFAALTEPHEVAPLLQAIDAYTGSFTVKAALQLAPMFFVRPGELRSAKWSQFDFEAKEWRYFVTKTESQHIVPLSTQAIDILYKLKP